MLAEGSRNHLKDRLLQTESKGVANTKKEQWEAPKAKLCKTTERIRGY